METSADRFKRIAEYRVNNVLNSIRILGNCSNKSAYSYTDAQIEKVFSTIADYLASIRAKFNAPKKEIDFKL